jgi:hypothetical protein
MTAMLVLWQDAEACEGEEGDHRHWGLGVNVMLALDLALGNLI